MAKTYRDLSMPTRDESWRVLRGLRSNPPGAAASSHDRQSTFQAALEQSQQLMDAAAQAGHATRPLQLFYALSQGGRAIAAVSGRLPTTSQVRRASGKVKTIEVPWKLRGHGIRATQTATRSIADVVVEADQSGLMHGVAVALGVEPLPPDEHLRIGDLWSLVPETHASPLAPTSSFPALLFDGGTTRRQTSNGYDKARLGYVPTSVREKWDADPNALSDFLDHYPTLQGWRCPTGEGGQHEWYQNDDIPQFSTLSIHWPYPPAESQEYSANIETLKATPYRTQRDCWAFPKIGPMKNSVHPLLVWWAVLFALSMMARYEPDDWASMIAIDSSPHANAIEHLLDQAIGVVPSILLEGIKVASTARAT